MNQDRTTALQPGPQRETLSQRKKSKFDTLLQSDGLTHLAAIHLQPGQHGETLSLLKIQKISQVWWQVSAVPATRQAEVGE